MQYVVQTVGDDELPEGIHCVIVETTGGPPMLIINGHHARNWAYMRAWENSLEAVDVPTVLSLVV